MATTLDVHARLPQDLMNDLAEVVKITARTRSSIICNAVANYVEDILADYQAAEIALARANTPERNLINSWEEMEVAIEEERRKNVSH